MIQGLQLKVAADEIRRHCGEMSQRYARLANEKEKELGSFRKYSDHEAAGSKKKFRKEDMEDDMRRDVTHFRAKSEFFKFVGSHLYDEDYSLQRNDIERLEMPPTEWDDDLCEDEDGY